MDIMAVVFYVGRIRKMGEQRIINVPRSLFNMFPLGSAVSITLIESKPEDEGRASEAKSL